MSMFHPQWLELLFIDVGQICLRLHGLKRLKDSHMNSQKHIAG